MSDASPHATNPGSIHHDEEHEHEHTKTPLGIRAACVVLAVVAIGLAYTVYQRNSMVTEVRTQLDQANADASQLKGDLDKAKAASADLQSQLDTSNRKLADQGTQIAKDKSQVASLQSQLDKSENQQSSLQSQVSADKASASDMQSQISQADAKSSDLSKQLDQEKAKEADLQSQLTKAQQGTAENPQPSAAAAKVMPVAAAFSKSFWTGSYTMHLTNQNPDPLTVNITVPGASKIAPVTTTIKGGATYDLKGLAAGQEVDIAGEGYVSVSQTVK